MARTKRSFLLNQAVGVSMLSHLMAFLLLAVLGMQRPPEPGRSLRVSWQEADRELQSIKLPQVRLASDLRREAHAAVELSVPVVPIPAPPLPPASFSMAADSMHLFRPISTAPIGSGGRSGRGAAGTSDAAGTSGPSSQRDRRGPAGGSGQDVMFFGAGGSAQNVVFVLDGSGSMKQPMRTQSREKVLKTEVMRAIRSLHEETSFHVIFFNEEVLELDERGLRRATEENRRAMLRWVRAIIPDGNTWPGPALERALSLEPDLIFFLTDGVFDVQTVDVVTAKNDQAVPIYTIALGDPRGAALLTRLASQNGGMYRYVP